MNALPATHSGMNASAAHNAGRHRGDSSRPSGKTTGRTRPVYRTAAGCASASGPSADLPVVPAPAQWWWVVGGGGASGARTRNLRIKSRHVRRPERTGCTD
jgi:hypothetical protein